MRQGAEMQPEEVGPQHHRQHTFPKAQVQEPDGEKPRGDPQRAHEGVLLNPYLLRFLPRSIRQVISSVGQVVFTSGSLRGTDYTGSNTTLGTTASILAES